MKLSNRVQKIVLSVIISAGILASAKNDQIEDYFENLSSQELEIYLKKMRVSSESFANQKVRVDIIDELNEGCKGFATYSKDASGNIIVPDVRCIYVADDGLDGMTPKFKCKFKDVKGEHKKFKVKYAGGVASSGKEIATGIVGASMARLMGFKADTYCPAKIICEGCSKDPWSKESGQNHSSEAAVQGVENRFDTALIEIKVSGWKLSEPRNGARKPLGFEWSGLSLVDESLSQNIQDQIRIEREAYMLWINFIYHTDADAHNNRLVCEQLEEAESNLTKSVCGSVSGYAHDYGDSFRRFDLNAFVGTPVFFKGWQSSAPVVSWGTEGNKCVGTMGGGEGAIGNAEFSDEARLHFLSRIGMITDEQFNELLKLAQVNQIGSKSSVEEWILAIRNKINEVKAKRCSYYSNGESVLRR
jgi:hypothetical protein